MPNSTSLLAQKTAHINKGISLTQKLYLWLMFILYLSFVLKEEDAISGALLSFGVAAQSLGDLSLNLNKKSTETSLSLTQQLEAPSIMEVMDDDAIPLGNEVGITSEEKHGYVRQLQSIPRSLEFPINTYTTDDQNMPRIAPLHNGSFVAVWSSDMQEPGDSSSEAGIFGQFIDSDGQRIGSEFHINTNTTDNQARPIVRVQPSGNFVACWQTDYSSPSGANIIFRIFNSDKTPRTTEIIANKFTTGYQRKPTMVVQKNTGNIVLAWESFGQETPSSSDGGVYMRIFTEEGVPLTDDIHVNTYEANAQVRPALGLHPNDALTVVWRSGGQDLSDSNTEYGIYAQSFHPTGERWGLEFPVHSYLIGNQKAPNIRVQSTGVIIFTWSSIGVESATGNDIYMRLMNATGYPLTPALQVNTFAPDDQVDSEVAIREDNQFWVTWDGESMDTRQNWNCYLRHYDEVGVPLSVEYQIPGNAYNQYFPSIVYNRNSSTLFLAWESENTEPGDLESDYGIRGMILSAYPTFELTTNQLIATNGQTTVVTTEMLDATGTNADSLTFLIEELLVGRFALKSQPSVAIFQFTLGQVKTGDIIFIHPGNMEVIRFNTRVTDGVDTSLSSIAITQLNEYLDLTLNSIALYDGQRLTLDTSHINVIDDNNDDAILFNVTQIEGIQLEFADNPGVAISSFSFADIKASRVHVVGLENNITPILKFTVTDGIFPLQEQSVSFAFHGQPELVNARLQATADDTFITVTSDFISALASVSDSQTHFNVANVTGGYFELTSSPGTTISSFTQEQVKASQVLFIFDQPTDAISFNITVFDGRFTTESQLVIATIDQTPLFEKSEISINYHETITLGLENFNVTDDTASFSEFTFSVSNLRNIRFSLKDNPEAGILEFAGAQVLAGEVLATHIGPDEASEYYITASDGVLTTAPILASVDYIPQAHLAITPQLLSGGYQDLTFPVDQSFSRDLSLVWQNPSQLILAILQKLPPGINFSNLTFVLEGTPLKAGTFFLTVIARNIYNQSLSAETSFNLEITPASIPAPGDSISRWMFLGISSGIGLILAGLKWWARHAANKKLDAMSTSEYDKAVIIPLIRTLKKRIQFYSFGVHMGDEGYELLKVAVNKIIVEINREIDKASKKDINKLYAKINAGFVEQHPAEWAQIKTIIASTTFTKFFPNRRYGEECCLNRHQVISHLRKEVSPKQLSQRAKDISITASKKVIPLVRFSVTSASRLLPLADPEHGILLDEKDSDPSSTSPSDRDHTVSFGYSNHASLSPSRISDVSGERPEGQLPLPHGIELARLSQHRVPQSQEGHVYNPHRFIAATPIHFLSGEQELELGQPPHQDLGDSPTNPDEGGIISLTST